MRVARLFAIVNILLRKKRVTAGKIAAELEVTERTVYRDIATLAEAGFPIVTTQGKGGGLGLMPSFVIDRSLLTRGDQGELLAAVGALGGPNSPLVTKLEALFQVRSRQWLEVDLSPWGASVEAAQTFPRLRSAILEAQSVEFSYRSQGQFARRRVDPLRLVFKHRAWYLLAWDHGTGAERTFRLSRIVDLGSPQGEPPAPTATPASPDSTVVGLVFRASARERVYEEFREQEIDEVGPGRLRVTTEASLGEWWWSLLLSFGPDLVGVEPETVRLELLARVSLLHENLRNPS